MEMKTHDDIVYGLGCIVDDENCSDIQVDAARAAIVRLSSLRESLRKEVARIEKLQPFASTILNAVEAYRKPTQ